MIVGFLGFGEAGSNIATGLKEEGISDIYAFDVLYSKEEFRDKLEEKAELAGTVFLEEAKEVVIKAHIIFLAVPANFAMDSTTNIVDSLSKGKIFVDVTTASPQEKKEISQLVVEKGASYVDSAMLGALPKYKHKVPMLISGNGCDQLIQDMKAFNMDLTKINEMPGAATSIKYIRSIVTKGLQALLVEALQTAQHFSVEDVVVDSIIESMDLPFEEIINRYVGSVIIHSNRRVHEMENVLYMLNQADLPSTMTEATMKKIHWLEQTNAKENLGGNMPKDWKYTIEHWGL
ncbi:NAD(P)-binding domain-containing protein [Ureibacillus sp. GCM10028918]|uniref:NAD(P)-binding domain-containing protein n=1 Tax=Ureibacillus sp. GCM10028918 TaxID=3273429 RepID=UPI00360D56A0